MFHVVLDFFLKFLAPRPSVAGGQRHRDMDDHEQIHDDRERFVQHVPVVEELLQLLPEPDPPFPKGSLPESR